MATKEILRKKKKRKHLPFNSRIQMTWANSLKDMNLLNDLKEKVKSQYQYTFNEKKLNL